MTIEEAQTVVNAYRCSTGKATESEYMDYMRAREILANLRVEPMTAGQRGFMAATRQNILGRSA